VHYSAQGERHTQRLKQCYSAASYLLTMAKKPLDRLLQDRLTYRKSKLPEHQQIARRAQIAIDELAKWRKITAPSIDSCWKYNHRRDNYANTRSNGKHMKAYALVYAQFTRREVPEGHHLHHTCENKWCVNPRHLVVLTASDHHKLHAKLRRERKVVS